jgi:hypothetical protein
LTEKIYDQVEEEKRDFVPHTSGKNADYEVHYGRWGMDNDKKKKWKEIYISVEDTPSHYGLRVSW